MQSMARISRTQGARCSPVEPREKKGRRIAVKSPSWCPIGMVVYAADARDWYFAAPSCFDEAALERICMYTWIGR